MRIAPARPDDHADFHGLYRAAAADPGGLLRTLPEITAAYTGALLARAIDGGFVLLARDDDGAPLGAILAVTPPERAFRHLLSDLTVFVDPRARGRGVGRALFERFLGAVERDLPHVSRVELFVREAHARAVRFYEALGFVREGRFPGKILGPGGAPETPLAMAWRRPGAQPDSGT